MTIVAFCNPLLDISIKLDDKNLLQKYGLKENNVILAEDIHAQLISDMISMGPVEYCAGGAGLNSLRAAQLMLEEGQTSIVGSIGKDEFGDILLSQCEKAGVKARLSRKSSKKTGHCACLINDHNRSLVAFLEAANDFIPEFLEPAMEALAAASSVYITGFFLAISRASVEQILASAPLDVQIIFNISAPFVCDLYGPELPAILDKRVGFIVGNGDELSAWAKSTELSQELSFDEMIVRLAEAFPTATLIITHGAAPVYLKRPSSPTIETISIPEIPAEEIIDTTGAGDAFVGGLLVALERNLTLEMGIQLGCFLAGQVIRQPGIKFPSPQILQSFIDSLLLKHQE